VVATGETKKSSNYSHENYDQVPKVLNKHRYFHGLCLLLFFFSVHMNGPWESEIWIENVQSLLNAEKK
jgi:hypothetical protein